MKKFARVSCLSARTDQSQGVGKNSDSSAGASYPAAGLDSGYLRLVAESWGATYADNLISDARWPTCRQNAAITAVESILRNAIMDVAAILSTGEDFKPHIDMMSAATWSAFQNAMPNPARRNIDAPTA
jgi:hypothetical protein